MKPGFVFSLAALVAILVVPTAGATGHFSDCAAQTGGNATLVVPATATVQAGSIAMEIGDEVAVFTTDGICAGVGQWREENLAITVWGDDVLTPAKEGPFEGEAISLRLWDASAGVEYHTTTASSVQYDAARPYYRIDGLYRENGIFVVASVALTSADEVEGAWKSVGTEQETPRNVPFTLEPNYPNPFNPGTVIRYQLDRESGVRLTVSNVLGQTVRVLVEGRQAAGEHEVRVDMSGMPSGLYLYSLESGLYSVTRTMLLSR